MNLRFWLVFLLTCSNGLLSGDGFSQDEARLEPGEVEIGGQSVVLTEPTLSGRFDAPQQQDRIAPYLRGLSYSQFTRDSIVAPVRINLKYIKDSSGVRLGHEVHVLFVVHEKLSTFSSEAFADALIGKPGDTDVPSSRPASPETLRSLGIEDADENTQYQNLRFDLLDKVNLDLLARITHLTTDQQNRIDFSLVDDFPNRWNSNEGIDSGSPYSGFRGWLTATSMKGLDAVLIEARIVFHEPKTWFSGDNFLRSKLPLVLQEAARDLRRKLKKKRPAD